MMKRFRKKNIPIDKTINKKNELKCSCISQKRPILVDLVRNCITINRHETTYFGGSEQRPLSIQTNLTGNDINIGDLVCINCVKYSYDCLGPDFLLEVRIGTQDPTINAIVDGNKTIFVGKNMSCSCISSTFPFFKTGIYNDFSGIIKSKSRLLSKDSFSGEVKEECYYESTISEKDIFFSICNLNIEVSGCIGNKCFTGVTGVFDSTFEKLNTTLPLSFFGLPGQFDFTGKICLPVNKKIILKERFDNSLKIDCIRPVDRTINNLEDNENNQVVFAVNAEISLSIRKTINAITREKIYLFSC